MSEDREPDPQTDAAAAGELEKALAWAAAHGAEPNRIEPLAGDVSTRRYVRLHGASTTAILALYPEAPASDCHRFERTSRLLSEAGVRVPRILAADCDHGRMLLEDVGPRTLYDHRDDGWVALDGYLTVAAEIIGSLQAIPPDSVAGLSPPLDRQLMARELDRTWAVALESSRLREAGFSTRLEEGLEELLSRLAEAPTAVAHRDFMARNLVPLPEEHSLVVLDHQDLRLAPAAYDLASLLNDSLYAPARIEERLLSQHVAIDRRLDYHRSAAQRCLKIVGTFVAFERRGFRQHLCLVRPSLERARRHLGTLPEMRPSAGELDRLIAALARAAADPSVSGHQPD